MAEAIPPSMQSAETFVAKDEHVVHHEKRKGREVNPARMQLNLTSMIDVIFQLLIYFVITASFAVGEGVIPADLPKGTGTQQDEDEPPKRPITIEISSVGQADYRINIVGFNEAPRNFAGLAQQLMRVQKNPEKGREGPYPPDNPVIIQPDGNVRWQHVVNAFNAAIKAQYTNISFAQVQEPGEG